MSLMLLSREIDTCGNVIPELVYMRCCIIGIKVGFFAPVIPFSKSQLQTLRNEIGSFVRGSMKTTINTVYNAIHQGGLGMIEIESYINAIKVGFFRKSINNDDFWAKEIQSFRISEDFPFHFKNSIATNTPCGELSVCVRTFCNVFWSTNGNFLDMRIFEDWSLVRN